MSRQDQDACSLMVRRTAAIAHISMLNARTHRLIQAMSGVEMDRLRLELEQGRNGESAQVAQNLQDVEQRAADLAAELEACAEEIEGAEASLAEIDAQIAETRPSA